MKKRKNKIIYSFDIFDTCITRSCGTGENVMFILAKSIVGDKDEALLHEFVRLRKEAEFLAINDLCKESVDIYEIYDYFDTTFFTDLSKDEIIAQEISIETHSFVPIRKTLELIDNCRQKGRVLFISDMYLPDSVLYSQLVTLGVINEGESLYVSCDSGLTKRSGKLFDYVRENEHLNDFKWIHYGDDYHNDILMPKKKGIVAKRLNNSFSRYENMWNKEAQISCNLSPSILAGIVRSLRLKNYVYNGDEFVPNIMAPLLVSFTLSLLKDAANNNINKLYFAARDMFLPYCIAKELVKKFEGIELHYIHISTKVVYPAYIENEPKEVLHVLGLLHNFMPISILEMFGFDENEIKDFEKRVELNKLVSLEDGTADEFVQELVSERNMTKLIKRCKEKRELLRAYLLQEGLLSNDNVALADIGWRCTTQDVLYKLFPDKNIHFYYYGVSADRLNIKDIGKYTSFTYNESLKVPLEYQFCIEYYICRNLEGTTLGYKLDEKGCYVPVLDKVNIDDKEGIINNYNIVLDTARLICQYDFLVDDAELLFYECALRTMKDFILYPQSHLVRTIEPYLFFNHFGDNYKIVHRYKNWKLICFLFLKMRKLLFHHHSHLLPIFWQSATIVNSLGLFGDKYIMFKRNKNQSDS